MTEFEHLIKLLEHLNKTHSNTPVTVQALFEIAKTAQKAYDAEQALVSSTPLVKSMPLSFEDLEKELEATLSSTKGKKAAR